MKFALSIAAAAAFAAPAAALVPHGEGAREQLLQARAVSFSDRLAAAEHRLAETDYTTYAMYGGGALVAICIAGGVAYAMKGKGGDEARDMEGKLESGTIEEEGRAGRAEPLMTETHSSSRGAARVEAMGGAAAAEDVDFERLLKLLAKRAAQKVGPKLAKAHSVRGVLVNRLFGLRKQVAQFVTDELLSTFGMVLREAGAEEFMLLLDPSASAASSLPPASILLAGLLSPVVLLVSLVIHLSQVAMVLLPTFCLCIWAIYIDWNTLDTCAVPTIWFWVYSQAAIAAILTLSHLATTSNINSARISIQQKIDSMQDRLREAVSDGELSIDEIRELFLIVSILLEHCLIEEDNLRRSIWRKIIGYGTIAWMAMTLWTFVIVLGWTFVPGMVAFHASAASVAGDDFCGAWATVFSARLTCVLSLLFLLCNMLSVTQFISDQLVVSESYSASVLSKARAFDQSMLGLPVVETFVKAFLLRGTADTIKAQIAVSRGEGQALEKQREDLQKRIDELDSQIHKFSAEAKVLKEEAGIATADDDEDESSPMAALASASMAAKAKALEEQTREEIDVLWKNIVEAANKIRDSSMEAITQAQEAAEQAVEQAKNIDLDALQADAQAKLAEASKEAEKLASQASSSMAEASKEAEKLAKQAKGDAEKLAKQASSSMSSKK